MNVIIKQKIKSELGEMEKSLKQIERLIAEAVLDQDVFFHARIILNELVCNGSIHGNLLDPQKEVGVFVNIDNHKIMIEVTDEGLGMGEMPISCEGSNFEYKDHGRGLVMVLGLSDKLEVVQNTVRATKYIS